LYKEIQFTAVGQTCLSEADLLKAQGNDLFRSSKWDEALVAYQSGLGQLPKRQKKVSSGKGEVLGEVGGNREEQGEDRVVNEPAVADVQAVQAATEEEILCAKARAVLNANIGACYVKLVFTRTPSGIAR
jgi:hypothetical protein